MRAFAALATLSLLPAVCPAANKLTFDDRIELTRGLLAEYGTAKVMLPRSRTPLEFDATAGVNKDQWTKIARANGPAARAGETIQVTKVDLEADRIVLQINGGYNGGRHWYHRPIVVQAGPSTMPTQTPVPIDDSDPNAPFGTTIAVLFHKPLEPIKAAEVKKLLAPVLNFDSHTATELYADTLPPEVKEAVKDKHALVGMTREQVLMALGRPEHKERQTKAGVELEYWTWGEAPGKFVFVTFKGDKAIEVKEEYAGLGTQVDGPAPPR
jgi:hypothetical protein